MRSMVAGLSFTKVRVTSDQATSEAIRRLHVLLLHTGVLLLLLANNKIIYLLVASLLVLRSLAETSNKWVQREVLLDWICRYDQFRGNSPIAANAVKALECVAASLLAVIGVTYSGLAGMNVVGCSVVGCAAALGGSTFSDIMTGRLARGGVFWARDPRFLALTLMSSLATFYALPSYETATATSLLNSIRSTAGLSPSSGISLPTFEKALVLSAELREVRRSEERSDELGIQQ